MTETFTIIQMNDTHGYLEIHQEFYWQGHHAIYRPAGGYARIASLASQIRQECDERVLFTDGGDTLHGTYPVVASQGQAVIPLLNRLGLDAMTAHWEFAYGPQVFKQRTTELSYPMLAINVYETASGRLFFQPYTIKELGGLRIGVIGIASNIVDKTMPPSFSTGLSFTSGQDELPQYIDLLRGQEHVDLVILLSHLGFPQDMQLLSEVEGVDVCLSSHTHNRVYTVAQQGKTLVMQSGSHGSFLGRLDLEIEGSTIASFKHRLLDVSSNIVPDQEMQELVSQALAPYTYELAEIVGETSTALNRNTALEATMDNFLLQALLEQTGAEMAFSNGWRYGAPVVPGPVTLNDLYNIIPMNPPVSTVELSGDELWTMLEENLEHTYSREPFRQMGGYVKRGLGLTVYCKIENPPGRRIHAIFVGDEALQREKYYRVAFVTVQGVPRKYGRNRQNLQMHAVDALRAYLKTHHTVQAELRGTFTPI